MLGREWTTTTRMITRAMVTITTMMLVMVTVTVTTVIIITIMLVKVVITEKRKKKQVQVQEQVPHHSVVLAIISDYYERKILPPQLQTQKLFSFVLLRESDMKRGSPFRSTTLGKRITEKKRRRI
jgi:MFS superfamily sulfate permease-like transporter